MPLPDARSFLELIPGPLHFPWGYDEPEILRYSNRHFSPIGADAGHRSAHCQGRYQQRANHTEFAHPLTSQLGLTRHNPQSAIRYA